MLEGLLASIPALVLLLFGGGVLLWSAERLVEKAEHLATTLSVPKAVVGAIVLGFGTSLPELLVCLSFIFDGDTSSAVANAVGSNIANVGVVLGGAALIAPVTVDRGMLRMELPLGFGAATILLAWAAFFSLITWTVGAVFLVAFAGFLYVSVARTKRHRKDSLPPDVADRRVLSDSIWIALALTGVAVGAELFTHGASGLASMLGVPNEVIGLSVVAFGTSLPEVVTTFSAARHGHPELAVGNIAGSNVFNLMFVLGICTFVAPLELTDAMRRFDFWALVIASLLTLPWLFRARVIGRLQGFVMVALYVGFQAFRYLEGRIG